MALSSHRMLKPAARKSEWLETVSIPDVDVEGLTHQHLLRSMVGDSAWLPSNTSW